jgi:hypothetical protein
MEILDEVGAEFLRLVAERIAAMGEDESGAYSYYAHRARQGYAFAPYERKLFEELKNETAVFHAGIGFGQLTVALSKAGVRCVGFEGERRRSQGAKEISDAISPYEVRFGFYPTALSVDDETDAVLLFTNVGAGWKPEVESAVIDTFPRFKRVILDLRLFGTTREDSADREALRLRIESRGFTTEACSAGPQYISVHPSL